MHSQRQQLRLQLLFSIIMVAAAARTAAATAAATVAAPAAEKAKAALATAPPVPPATFPAAAANATCSRSKHVVLASFGEPEEYHTVSLYLASKFPNASVHHLWLHLENKKEEAATETKTQSTTKLTLRWQLLKRAPELKKKKKTHRCKSSVDWRAFYRSHGIHSSIVEMASLDAYHKLRTTYLHSSINGYEYELLCFARFIGLEEFCSSKGIDQLTWIDADIPIFDPGFLDRVCLPRGYSVWALTSGSSFLNTMTCSEIGRFIDFMLDFYAQENRHALVRAIHAHGSSDMASATHVADQVRQAEPAFSELGIDPKHFSDMFLFSKFLRDTNANAAARKTEENQETASSSERKIYEKTSYEKTKLPTAPRRHQSKAYIHQDENNGVVDRYFSPVLSIRNAVSFPDSEQLCLNETVWSRYYSPSGDLGGDGRDSATTPAKAPQATTQATTVQAMTQETAIPSGFGLSFNESGTWIPMSGAHFQGSDCKARLQSIFSVVLSEDPMCQQRSRQQSQCQQPWKQQCQYRRQLHHHHQHRNQHQIRVAHPKGVFDP